MRTACGTFLCWWLSSCPRAPCTTLLSPWFDGLGSGVENQRGLSIYFSTLSSVPLNDDICPVPVPPRLDRGSFAVSFGVWERESATLALLQDCLGCFGCFLFHMDFKIKLSLWIAHTKAVGVLCRGGEGCVFLSHSPPYFFETVSQWSQHAHRQGKTNWRFFLLLL